jgi:hypothetical protein
VKKRRIKPLGGIREWETELVGAAVKRWILMLWFALLPLPLWASDWSKTDIAFEATYLTMHALDWGQTLDIAERNDTYHERNPLLGKHPTRGGVNTYFALTALLHLAIANWLDAPARTYFQIGSIALEATVIGNNYSIGLKLAY